jgi:hypothetical protein
MLLTAFILAVLFASNEDSYKTRGGDEVFSNSSKVEITRSPDPLDETTVVSLRNIHGYFGFSNDTCEPDGPLQRIPSVLPTNVIGHQETWFKVLLRGLIDNTATNVYRLENDGYTVSILEPGEYGVESTLTATVPKDYAGEVETCVFVEVDGIGLTDALARVGFICNTYVFSGTGPRDRLITLGKYSTVPVTSTSECVLRYIFSSTSETEVLVSLVSLKFTKI